MAIQPDRQHGTAMPLVPTSSGSSVVRARTSAGYEILVEIPGLGSAPVFLAREPRSERIVALRRYVARPGIDLTRFVDDAQIAMRLRHPNLVPTVGLGGDEQGAYVANEYIEGDTLLELMRAAARDKRPVAAPIAVRIALDALRGLHAAHEMSAPDGRPFHLVHRGVSPLAVYVGTDGVARMMDFAFTRIDIAGDASTSRGEHRSVARMGYLAPEQTSGEPVDRRADIFSLGVVLWECLAGRRLFPGRSADEVMRALTVTPIPRLGEAAPALPRALDEVLARALARGARLRWATAAEFAEALEVAAHDVGIAPARAVGEHVRALSGEKIARLARFARGSGEAPALPEHEETTQRRGVEGIQPDDMTLDAVPEPTNVTSVGRKSVGSLSDWTVDPATTPMASPYTDAVASNAFATTTAPMMYAPARPASHRGILRAAAAVFVLVALLSALAVWKSSQSAPTVVTAVLPIAAPRPVVAPAPQGRVTLVVEPAHAPPVAAPPVAAPAHAPPVATAPAVTPPAIAIEPAAHEHHRHHRDESSASTSTTPTEPAPAEPAAVAPAPVVAPRPSNEPYNPEAM